MNYYPFSILCAAVIVVLSVMNMNGVPQEILTLGDKALHSMAYAGWTFILLLETAWNRKTVSFLRVVTLGIALPVVFGGGMELVQAYLFPPRQGDWWDVAADLVGALTATVAFLLTKQWIIMIITTLKSEISKYK